MTAKCLVVGGVGTRDKRTFQRNGLATFTTSWANPSQGRDKKQFPSLILGQRCNEPRMYNCRALEVASRAVFSGGQWLLLTLCHYSRTSQPRNKNVAEETVALILQHLRSEQQSN